MVVVIGLLVRLRKENEKSTKELKELSNDKDIKQLIINNLHIVDNGEPRILSSECSYTSSEGTITKEYVYDNPDASFNPNLDEFNIVDIDFNYIDMLVRIKVDCIRRHKLINSFMWEPDYYWTDWIDLNEFGEINI